MPFRSLSRRVCVSRGGLACEPAEHRTRHQTGATRVIEIEQPTKQFAGCVQAANRQAVGVYDVAMVVDSKPAERESYSAGDCIGFEWRGVEGIGPVRFVQREATGASSIFHVRIEGNRGLNGRIKSFHLFQKTLRIDVFEFARQLLK